MDIDASEYMTQSEYDKAETPVYSAPLSWAVNKEHSRMAKVLYQAAHFNAEQQGIKRGSGNDFATWIFSEEKGKPEHILSSSIELMIDATFDPHAAIGLHSHSANEEIYYILDGSISMTTVNNLGEETTAVLRKGDAHLVKAGQSHYGKAGENGVRFICVAARV